MQKNILSASCILSVAATAVACQTKEVYEVTNRSVAPASEITWVGHQTKLLGQSGFGVGSTFPESRLTSLKMQPATIRNDGVVKVINTIPSIDTPVCEQQTHIIGHTKKLDPSIARIVISHDLPYAQSRFAEEAKLDNIAYYSDYRNPSFAQELGLKIERNDLLARAVIVVDQKGIVRYMQVVPEITQMPDMDRAFAEANRLLAPL